MSREAIQAALFAKLAAIPGLGSASRRLRHWADVAAADQPALMLTVRTETVQTRERVSGVHRVQATVTLYARSTDQAVSPQSLLNPLIDAVEAAIAPTAGEHQTLGGLVQQVRVSGRIETDAGALGDQGVAIVPLEILFAA